MLWRLRQKLQMIRYYSASTQRTVWSRAADLALVMTLPIGIAATWIADHVAVRSSYSHTITGRLRLDGPRMLAALDTKANALKPVLTGVPQGSFQLQIEHRHYGWPLTTTLRRPPARLDLDILAEPVARMNVELAADSPLRNAIEQALREESQHEALAAMRRVHTRVERSFFAWPMAAGAWWIMLAAASWLTIGVVKSTWILLHGRSSARKAALRAQGKCIACGYDMRGLEFHARCPECGELVW